jgi:hypothetical protein
MKSINEMVDWLLTEAVKPNPEQVFASFMEKNRVWIEQLDKGSMYCGFFSELLRQEFKKNRVKATLLHLLKAKDKGIIEKIQDEGHDVKDFGHVVVLVEETVYDPTAMQFGIDEVYPLSKAKEQWGKVQTKVKIDLRDYDQYPRLQGGDSPKQQS